MKANIILSLLFVVFLFSCSSDSDNSNSNNDPFSLTLTDGDYWTYDVNGDTGASRDSLYIANDTVISGKTYKKFKTKDLPTGFYSSSLNNNGVRKDGNKLLLSGTLELGANQGLPSNISISLNDFVIFNPNATEGTTLATFSSSFQQTVGTYPLTVNYTLKSKAGSTYTNYNSNGEIYGNVKTTIITLDMSVTTVLSGFTITVLNNQQVLNSEQFIAENIGVIKTNSSFSYNMDATLASQIGIPASASQSQNEIIDTYFIN